MSQNVISKSYRPNGLNLQSTELTRPMEHAADGLNFVLTPNGQVAKRFGYQTMLSNVGGFGIVSYNIPNSETASLGWGALRWGLDVWGSSTVISPGAAPQQLLTLDSNLWKTNIGNLSITYTGTTTAVINIYASTIGVVTLKLTDNDVDVLTYSLGDGISNIVSLNTLHDVINSTTNFTSTINGDGTQNAAFLTRTRDATIVQGGSADIDFWYYTKVPSPLDAQMPGTILNRNNDNFENPSTVFFNNVVYIANGYDPLCKYDGVNFYNAGLPNGVTPTPTNTVISGNPAGTYRYKMTYVFTDNQGNVVESIISDQSSAVIPASVKVDVAVSNIRTTSGYLTNVAIAKGTQSSVNVGAGLEQFTVVNNPTLVTGDSAYFYDTASNSYLTLIVRSVTDTTITLESSNSLGITDASIISANLRIRIYRTKTGGSLFFLVAEIPNDPTKAAQVYVDNLADGSLGFQYISPAESHGVPPVARYVTTFHGRLILAGDPLNPNTFYWGSADQPETFHGLNSDTIFAKGDQITAIGVLRDYLIVFKSNSVFYVNGDLTGDNFSIAEIPVGGKGCVANATLKEISSTMLYLSIDGVYSISPYRLSLQKVTDALDPVFQLGLSDDNNHFRKFYRRATAVHWELQNLYILFFPKETLSTNKFANNDSRVFVFDYHSRPNDPNSVHALAGGTWFQWSNINAAGGLTIYNNIPVFSSRESSGTFTSKFMTSGFQQDYVDHVNPIQFLYVSGWEFLGEPTVYKNFLRLNTYSFSETLPELPNADIIVSTEVDFEVGSTDTSLTVSYSDQGSAWGTFSWGDDPWGGFRDSFTFHKLKSGKRRSLRLRFENSQLAKQLLIGGWALQIAEAYGIRINR